MHRWFFLVCCWAAGYNLLAQQEYKGIVTDPAGAPLAFVGILIDDAPGKGTLTDIEGRFTINATGPVQTLTFRYVGFETRRIPLSQWSARSGQALTVVLQPADYALPEATVRAGENPADILIRKAIANRRRNNPELRAAYRCSTYNKIIFDALPQRMVLEELLAGRDTTKTTIRRALKNFDQLERAMAKHHAFLMESVTERDFLFPNLVQEKVLLNRVSGFRNAGLVALANLVQPFSFYSDYLTILDKNFVNPVSPGSPNLYFFNIEDTLYAGPDTVWVISFHPRKGKVFEGLEGVLHLNSHAWAIQNVRARPARAGNLDLRIEQAYRLVRDSAGEQWFPEQLNFELEFKQYPAPYAGVRAAGRSYITGVRLDVPLRLRHFDAAMPVLLTPDAGTRADSAWLPWRVLAPLSDKELNTYRWLDSLGQRKRFDRLSALMDMLVTGQAPLAGSPVSLDLTRVLRLNEYENVRLGLGLTTAQAKPLLPQRRLEFGAYAGYGFRDQDWKYGGYALWRITRSGQQLRVDWQHDLLEPGALYELPPASLVNRALYAKRMDRADEFSAALESRLGRSAHVGLRVRRQRLRPGYPYRFGEPDTGFDQDFRFAESTLFFRFARGERSHTFLGNDIGSTQRLPVLELAYTRGWRGVAGGEYAYDRWVLALHHAFFVRRLGRTNWRVEAGWVTPGVPMAKLFTLNQTGGGWNLFVVRNTFQALPDTLFLANRFVNLYFAQEIGPVLYQSKHSAPTLSLLQNAAWGELRRPELHHDAGFRTARRPLLESGLQLDNLLRVNYLNVAYLGLGGAVFYRWGGLGAVDWRDNVSFRLTLLMTL